MHASQSAPYSPDAGRYDGAIRYRRCGRSGLALPAISLGLWQNFGGADVFETGRAMLRRAFDRGVVHFDLANNYGPPYGSAEQNFGRWFASDFRPFRDELLISTKAGYDMWPGPFGGPSGSRKHLIASCDQSLKRMGLDHVDIFYSHRMAEDAPVDETAAALAHIHRTGRALYVGVSNYSPERTRRMAELLAAERIPLTIHQPRYSMLDRTVEGGLLDTLEALGIGCIVFSPLAQGLLTDRYLDGLPADSRAAKGRTLTADRIGETRVAMLRELDALARARGQTLAQLAISWVLRAPAATSALVGARTVAQLDDLLDAATAAALTDDELARIEALLARDDPPR